MKQYNKVYGFLLLVLFFIVSIVVYDEIHVAQATHFENHGLGNKLSTELLARIERINSDQINAPNATPTNCRYGVVSGSNKDFGFLQELGVGWVLNFNFQTTQTLPDHVEYVPMIYVTQEKDGQGNRLPNYITGPTLTDGAGGLGPIIAANPGKLWIVGNEVDRIFVQGDIMPDIYAIAYHDVYHFIKDRDPSAQIALSGLVEVTPGRLQYLDIVWDSYLEMYGVPMPVDVWNMHIYIFPEIRADGTNSNAAVALGTDPALAILESGNDPALCPLSNVYCYAEHDDMGIFADQAVAMRQWMKSHGQQDKPLILSEFSLLYPYDQEGDSDPNTCFLKDEFGNCFTPDRVSQFMMDSFSYLETAVDTSIGYPADNHKLVQQWLWFSIEGDEFAPYRLLEEGYTSSVYTPTLVGQTFVSEVDAIPLTTSLFINQVGYPIATIEPPNSSVSVTLSADVFNNGNTETTGATTVTFYADAAKTVQIGTDTVPTELSGCARRSSTAEVVWGSLGAGVHAYWAEVDGGNTVEGFVIINPEQIFLPLIQR